MKKKRIPAPPKTPDKEREPSDEALMARVQMRDANALAELYDRHAATLKAMGLHMLHNEAAADDLLQEVFVELWRRAGDYSPKKGKPLGWLVTLSRRRAIDRVRKDQAYARAEERLQNSPEQQPLAWTHNLTEEAIDSDDRRGVITAAIRELPAPQQQAIELAFFRGMSQREIAAHTNIPLGTVKTRLELGLKKIAEALKPYKDEF